MKKLLAVFCLLLPLLEVAAQDKTAELEVAAFMQRYQQASLAKDAAFVDGVLSKDYSYTNPYGFAESRSAMMDFIRSEKAKPSFTVSSFKTDNQVIRIYGNTAIVTSDWTMNSTQPLAHSGDSPHQDKGRHTGILVKQDGRWMIVQEHDSEQAHDKKVMEQQVAALGRAYSGMIQRNDTASIAGILADDYLLADESGKVYTKEQDLTTYKDRVKSVKIDKVEYIGQKVRMITGSVAIEHSTVRFVGTKNSKPFDITERITTTWHFREGRWVIVSDHFSYLKE